MHKPEIRPLLASNLLVDHTVQRPLDPRRVARIAAEFNFDALGTVTVSQRANGDHVIIDGQHRIEAMKEAGHSSSKVTCRVFSGLALSDEAAMFRLLNNTAKPQYLDLFRVRVVEGEPNAVALNRIAKRHGWAITHTPGDGSLHGIAAFERIYLMDPAAAETALATVTRAWGHAEAATDGRVLEGVGLVYARYGSAVEADALTDRLARFAGGPGRLLGRARGLREHIGSTLPRAVAEIVVEEYNRRRKGRALPGWRAS